MNFHLQFFLLVTLLLCSLVLSTPHALPEVARAVSALVPTAYTDSRSANTQFGAPTTVGSAADSTATGETTRTANTVIEPSAGNGTMTPAPATESRSANTEIAGPSTAPSTTLATANYAPTMGPVGWDSALKIVVIVGVGMGIVG
ncbi:hypothetical protein AOQ84DRAFT_436750 [Glonium stellatum]|uniref:Uncharacterized protein n=1 Tax=Glonium stellatum TaxID=574774 RepID=A0A8E2F8Y0_9PEZI|nr:hypothetical protein AOQ84DRAFT_436750 [Glonium stellatum]